MEIKQEGKMLFNLLPIMSIQSFQVTLEARHCLADSYKVDKERARGFQTFQAMIPMFYKQSIQDPHGKNNSNKKIVIQSSKVMLINVKFPFILVLDLCSFKLIIKLNTVLIFFVFLMSIKSSCDPPRSVSHSPHFGNLQF